MPTETDWEQRSREHFQGDRAYNCEDAQVQLAVRSFQRGELTWVEAYAVFERWEKEHYGS